MKVKLVPIGNSKGIRIPQSVIRQCGFVDQVEMRVDDGVVMLAPAQNLREDWDTAFQAMAKAGDDTLLLPDDIAHDWDDAEWEW